MNYPGGNHENLLFELRFILNLNNKLKFKIFTMRQNHLLGILENFLGAYL